MALPFSRSKIVRIFTYNLPVKLSLFALAATLWLAVVTSSEVSHTVRIPIRLRNLQEGRVLKEPIPEYAEVKYRGTGRAFLKNLLTAAYSDMGLMLEMSRIRKYYDFDLKEYIDDYPDRIMKPRDFGLEMVELVRPDTVKVRLDAFSEKVVPVAPRAIVNTFPGYIQVGSTHSIPSEVLIGGPASQVELIDSIYTEMLNFEAQKSDVDEDVRLVAPEGGQISLSPEKVRLEASVQSIGERELDEIPVIVRNVPPNLKAIVNPSSVKINLQGGIAFLASLKGGEIEASIDYSKDWTENQRFYTPRIEVPGDVINWNWLDSARVEVIVIQERR